MSYTAFRYAVEAPCHRNRTVREGKVFECTTGAEIDGGWLHNPVWRGTLWEY